MTIKDPADNYFANYIYHCPHCMNGKREEDTYIDNDRLLCSTCDTEVNTDGSNEPRK